MIVHLWLADLRPDFYCAALLAARREPVAWVKWHGLVVICYGLFSCSLCFLCLSYFILFYFILFIY